MQCLDLDASASGWAAASVADLRKAAKALGPLSVGPRSLVIGWGLPPSLLAYLELSGAVFVDVEVDPIRFGRHLHLCVRTNDAQISDVLRSLEVSVESFWDAATTINCSFARKGVDYLVAPGLSVGLFAGQTAVDLALVCEGELRTPEDCLDDLRRMAEEMDVLLVKPHPYAGNSVHLDGLFEQIPNAIPTSMNIYAMFTARNLKFVAGLSSGALKEAEFFGVDGRALFTPDRNNPDRLPDSCSRWFTVAADIGTLGVVKRFCDQRSSWFPRFLRRENSAQSGFSLDALDRIFGARWGLNFDAPGLPESCLVTLEKVYAFAQGSGATGWLGAGWHDPEPWGVWGASKCELFLPFEEGIFSPGESLVFELTGHVYGNATARADIVAMDVNGTPTLFRVEQDGEKQTVRFQASGERLGGRGYVRIAIRVQGAARPVDVSGQPDERMLGFGLTSLVAAKCPPPTECAETSETHIARMDNPDPSAHHQRPS